MTAAARSFSPICRRRVAPLTGNCCALQAKRPKVRSSNSLSRRYGKFRAKLIGKVKAHCEKTGVDITPVPRDWNQILKPPPKLSMTNAQELILDAIKRDKQIKSVGVMASPDAALVEYALLKESGLQVSAGDDGRTRVVIPINDKLKRHRGPNQQGGARQRLRLAWRDRRYRRTCHPDVVQERAALHGHVFLQGDIYNLVNIGGRCARGRRIRSLADAARPCRRRQRTYGKCDAAG